MSGVHRHDDEYMMYAFKVKPCPRLDHHNWKHCPHRHPGEVAAQRRHPSLHKPAFCMNLKLYGSCAAGDDCPFSHNTFEMSLHPERYKTTLCTLGDKCNREICFFAHSTGDLRTPDVTAPLGALGSETTISLTQFNSGDAAAVVNSTGAPAASQPSDVATADSLRLMQQQQLQPQQSGDLQHLLRQVEHQLQLEPGSQQQQAQLQQQHQQLLQQDQQAMLLAQVQAQQQHQQQQQQQMNELMLAQQQILLANAAQQRGSMSQQQLMMLQDAAQRGESFTSQCSTASYVSGIGALRAAQGSLPVSPLIDRSAHSFTITDRSATGSFTTLGSVPERPHSFSVGDLAQQAALLASLGERPPSFTLLDASRPNSFTLGQQQQPSAAAFAVERSAASLSMLDSAGGLGSMLGGDGGLSVVERTSQTQRSFTMGQRPTLQQLQQLQQPWYEADAIMVAQDQAQAQQQSNGSKLGGLGALCWR